MSTTLISVAGVTFGVRAPLVVVPRERSEDEEFGLGFQAGRKHCNLLRDPRGTSVAIPRPPPGTGDPWKHGFYEAMRRCPMQGAPVQQQLPSAPTSRAPVDLQVRGAESEASWDAVDTMLALVGILVVVGIGFWIASA